MFSSSGCVGLGCDWLKCVKLRCVRVGSVLVWVRHVVRDSLIGVCVSPAYVRSLLPGLVSSPVVGGLLLSLFPSLSLWCFHCAWYLPVSPSQPSVFCMCRLPHGLCSRYLWPWKTGELGAST